MKRSGIQRKTEMKRTGALNRNAEISRNAAPKRKAELKAKPKPVTPEEKRTRTLVKARSNSVCEGCDRARAAHMSHRVAEGQGGPWCPSNILHLCAQCHTGWAHLNPTEAKAVGWIVPNTEDPETVPVHLAHGRVVYLDADGGVTPATEGEEPMAEFKQYRRSQIAEMADWEPGFDMTGVSVSDVDREAGSPKRGDKIARNPKNHDDKWLVAAVYAADNFEPVEDAA